MGSILTATSWDGGAQRGGRERRAGCGSPRLHPHQNGGRAGVDSGPLLRRKFSARVDEAPGAAYRTHLACRHMGRQKDVAERSRTKFLAASESGPAAMRVFERTARKVWGGVEKDYSSRSELLTAFSVRHTPARMEQQQKKKWL